MVFRKTILYFALIILLVVINIGALEITIGKKTFQMQGRMAELKVMKTGGDESMIGFDFLIGYPSLMFLDMRIERGEIFYYIFQAPWDHFDYEIYPDSVFINDALLSLIHVKGLKYKEREYKISDPTALPDSAVLFTLHFFISNNRNYNCTDTPIRFIWSDCEDNRVEILKSYIGDKTETIEAVSNKIFHHVFRKHRYYGEREITEISSVLPTIYGYPDDCNGESVNRLTNFHNGCITITNNCYMDDRGDINLNGIPNEIADALLFKSYFVYGLDSFRVYIEGQIAATDVLNDNNPLTVRDFVYLCQMIYGDMIVPPTKIRDSISMHINLGYAQNDLSVSAEYDKPVAALHLIFGLDGCSVDSVYLHPDIDYMAMEYSEKNDTLRIFIYPKDVVDLRHFLDIPGGNLLKITYMGKRPDLLSAQAAGRMSEKVKLIIND